MHFRIIIGIVALAWAASPLPASPPEGGEGGKSLAAEQKRLWEEARKTAELMERKGDAVPRTEAALMFHALRTGKKLGPDAGWFGPGRTRHDWKWLAERFDTNNDRKITRDELGKPGKLFGPLDRDQSGEVTAEDLDWSEGAAYVREEDRAVRFFRSMDANGDGHLSREEWGKFYDKLSDDGKDVNPEHLRLRIFPPPRQPGNPARGGAEGREKMLRCLLRGDLGSPFEGPALGELAPDFTLSTHDGKKVMLSALRGKKPVVLIFGSFT